MVPQRPLTSKLWLEAPALICIPPDTTSIGLCTLLSLDVILVGLLHPASVSMGCDMYDVLQDDALDVLVVERVLMQVLLC